MITGWITDSLNRTKTYNQRKLLTVEEVLNPVYNDPWAYNTVNYAFCLLDGYITIKFPAAGTYKPYIDRYPMAREATKEIMRFLESVNIDTDQTTELMEMHVQKFFMWLYAWNTEVVWIDKIHPEDICAKILFNTPLITYAQRSALVGGLSPDFFLRGEKYYETQTWVTNLTEWGALAVAEFPFGDETFSLYYPGQGYSFGTERTAFELQSQSRGLTFSLLGVLANAVSDKSVLQTQSWPHRLAILTDAATYCNLMFSYILRVNS